MITACLGMFGIIVLVAVVCLIAESDKKLPKPRHDERNWSINYMTDFKRWTR